MSPDMKMNLAIVFLIVVFGLGVPIITMLKARKEDELKSEGGPKNQ
jgi:hypothetical protein